MLVVDVEEQALLILEPGIKRTDRTAGAADNIVDRGAVIAARGEQGFCCLDDTRQAFTAAALLRRAAVIRSR